MRLSCRVRINRFPATAGASNAGASRETSPRNVCHLGENCCGVLQCDKAEINVTQFSCPVCVWGGGGGGGGG